MLRLREQLLKTLAEQMEAVRADPDALDIVHHVHVYDSNHNDLIENLREILVLRASASRMLARLPTAERAVVAEQVKQVKGAGQSVLHGAEHAPSHLL